MQLNRLLVAALVVSTNTVNAHGGGLNAEGCHHNRRTGDYHCHRAAPAASPSPAPPAAPASGRSGKASRSELAKANAGGQNARESATGAPTCFVGPRGGTYTITASGRKNYGGC